MIMHELIQAQINSPFFYRILLVIEACQFFWFAIHPSFSYLWTSKYASYPRDIVKFLQV